MKEKNNIILRIVFQKMCLEDKRTVKISGNYKNNKIEIRTSILQLAKLFKKDKKVLKKLEKARFGDERLEDECKETREVIGNFLNSEMTNNEIKCSYVSLTKYQEENFIIIYAEDIVGWPNEGIHIKIPKNLYSSELKNKEFDVILKQNSIEFRSKTGGFVNE